jgi:hypothetical protein
MECQKIAWRGFVGLEHDPESGHGFPEKIMLGQKDESMR